MKYFLKLCYLMFLMSVYKQNWTLCDLKNKNTSGKLQSKIQQSLWNRFNIKFLILKNIRIIVGIELLK